MDNPSEPPPVDTTSLWIAGGLVVLALAALGLALAGRAAHKLPRNRRNGGPAPAAEARRIG